MNEFENSHFLHSALESDENLQNDVVNFIKDHGWVTLWVDNDKFKDLRWESVFQQVFVLSEDEKVEAGAYSSVNKLAVGYRNDNERQFIECRMTSACIPQPTYKQVTNFNSTVKQAYTLLLTVAKTLMMLISDRLLMLDKNCLIDLTDLSINSSFPSEDSEVDLNGRPQLASSLLRICSYEGASNDLRTTKPIRFGAHTDTSFLTVALHSSTPGLEIADQKLCKWICPESELSSPSQNMHGITIFIGEYLELLTKHRLKATIHRVVSFDSKPRISCPMIIRGESKAIIRLQSPEYTHPGGEEAVGDGKVADLDGVSMGVVQAMLDRKRKRCFEQNEDCETEWVLSSFPIYPLPV